MSYTNFLNYKNMENFNHKSSHAAEDNQINQQLSAAHYVNPAGVEFPVIAYNNVPLEIGRAHV